MTVDELEVYVTADGLGRAAIARRHDGFFCIYRHWKLSERALEVVCPGTAYTTWLDDQTPQSLLYEDVEPERGIYGTLDDARREMRSMPGFSDATLVGT